MPAKIELKKDGVSIGEFLLDKDSLVIGRKRECDISINDSAVSGVHARIVKIGEKYQIKDMQSTNGLHCKGRQIDQKALSDGDLIVIGEHQLIYVAAVEIAAKAKVKKVASKPEPVKSDDGVSARIAAAKRAEAPPAYLTVLSGKDKDRKIELNEPLVSVGIPGVQMAAVSSRPQGHFIVHVDGGKDRNRLPVVNGESIGFRSRKLEYGDIIEVADMEMEYCVSDVTVIKLS